MSLGVRYKGPDESIVYAVDWGDYLDTDRDGTADDTINTVTWTLADGLTKVSESNTTTVASVKISGGTIGQTYKVECQIATTTSTETFERFFTLHVVDR